MLRPLMIISTLTIGMVAGAAASLAATDGAPKLHQHSQLLARDVLPATTFRDGSPPSGAFLTTANRASAASNGVPGPGAGPYFTRQPVQGISALVPAGDGTWWALADNGYGTRESSADWQLAVYRIDPHFGDAASPEVISTVLLSDPRQQVPWKTVCDPTRGFDLPPFSFNVLPASPPAACEGGARVLTGFDFDPESLQVSRDGTFWIGDEFGPFLLHADRRGRLLEAPISAPGLKAPQNPTIDVEAGERPTVPQSRGFESLAISPDRGTLYPMLEGAAAGDDPRDLRILRYDIGRHRYARSHRLLRLEMPGAKVNLATLQLVGGAPAYPGSTAPTGTGGESAAELTAVNEHELLVVERDSEGDTETAPRMKKVFLLDARSGGPFVGKSVLLDLMAVPDPGRVGGDGDFFRFPLNTIEAVHVASSDTVIVANDNNFPFSNARSRSRTNTRTGPFAPDDNELILVRVGTPLRVDHRLLSAPRR